jgi:predicted transcriptional regulator
MRPLHATRKRRPRKREVSRSFRIPPDVDRELDKAARAKRWSKSFLIRDILVGWLTYQRANERVAVAAEVKAEKFFQEGKHDDA